MSFNEGLQFLVEHFRLFHVYEVSTSGQFRIVELRIQMLHFLLIVRIKTTVLRTDDHCRQRNRAICPHEGCHSVRSQADR